MSASEDLSITKINFRAKHDAQAAQGSKHSSGHQVKAPLKDCLFCDMAGTAEQNNFSKFREELSIYCLREFGDLGRTANPNW